MVPPSTTSAMVTTPVIARTSTPRGTGTAKLLVFCAAVDIVPGTAVMSALAGAAGTATKEAADSVVSSPTNADAPRRRRRSSPAPRTYEP